MNLKINYNKIDDLLYDESINMDNPIFDRDLGTILYFSNRYLYSKEIELKVKAEKLLDAFITKFGSYEYEKGILTGFEGVFWVIKQLERSKIISDSEGFLKDIELNLITSINSDILSGNFELFYGFIGKIQYFLTSKEKLQKVEKLVFESIETLWNCKIEKNEQIYWASLEGDKFIDLGIAHGITGVLTYLTRLKELGFKNKRIDKLIEGVLKTITNSENKINIDCSFPSVYSIDTEFKKNNFYASRLGFCKGDLPIAYALYYYGVTDDNIDVIKKAESVIGLIVGRDISNSSLLHLSEYDFFDIGFCHGISGILFMLSRINQWCKNDNLEKRILYWKRELINNTNKLIAIEKTSEIIYSSRYNKFDRMFELDKNSFLNGICGAGLTLLAVENNDYTIGNFLSLY
ncbi:lanthionine synthetase LanC family protein [Tenacibaculum finnmarkense]|uniref:lanthionine synthetase LanC family protein n=1 Tax=Tenacibaculum finnmarkense TaxID=2781243 RepID=UPI001E32A2A5|nr:lanthionine synthetase LanC family protein [Tenacibaculum finnmarkense]MCD8411502.1 hypothetical protein [Tenacibaculum finnmarkense genomovar ulcerans]MCG8208276.1 hypothetical protein [Tenacibaculum finnmarkense genomovar finnmarkense]MCG8724241.1 hypothetical protein [Tenacibaculum finnmarkense]MCG8742579.1 hypothetical protein [Tenacibaculum finnmarkense]MCG8765963.1 hypothetical protein [Tenacibaculum finnmarkense]